MSEFNSQFHGCHYWLKFSQSKNSWDVPGTALWCMQGSRAILVFIFPDFPDHSRSRDPLAGSSRGSARNSDLLDSGRRFKVLWTDSVSQNVPWIGPTPPPIHPASEISITFPPTPYQLIHPGMSQGNRAESPQGLIISLRNATCLSHLEGGGAVACVLRWVGGGRGQGPVRVFGAGDLDQGVHITNTHLRHWQTMDLWRTILPWTKNMGEWSVAQSEGPSLLVHPSGDGAGVGGVHRISGTGSGLGYGGRVQDIHMLPW